MGQERPKESLKKRPGKKQRLRVRRFLLGCVALPMLLLGGALLWAWAQLRPAGSGAQAVTVVVPPRTGSAEIADLLARRGLIRNALLFRLYAGMRGTTRRWKPGEYRLSPDMTAAEIAQRLAGAETNEPGAERSVTIPEGFTLQQIAERLEAQHLVPDAAAFLADARRKPTGFSAPFPLPESGLEGYLYPETYQFAADSSPNDLAQTMLDRFTNAFYEPNRGELAQSGHSLHEIVTIASLIEKEAKIEEDRARIAGVIENRLHKGMRLQIDATVLYALGYHKNRVMYADLKTESPYNTYRHAGLPPGPIASPGLASLKAALHPENHDYLFYVAGSGGAHIFTRTEAEHNAAIARLRQRRNLAP